MSAEEKNDILITFLNNYTVLLKACMSATGIRFSCHHLHFMFYTDFSVGLCFFKKPVCILFIYLVLPQCIRLMV